MVVFTGILPIMNDEEGMATVLAHEIGHVVASMSCHVIVYYTDVSNQLSRACCACCCIETDHGTQDIRQNSGVLQNFCFYFDC